MRSNAGFTILEMAMATVLFAAGAVYVYSTFAGVTQSSQSATISIDLGSQNKRSLTRLFSELQATSLTPQDTDGLDNTEPEAVFVVEDDDTAPAPHTKAKVVTRMSGSPDKDADGNWKLGASKEQARERTIAKSTRIRFRKVVGYQFNATSGSIGPEWSDWITFRLNANNQLVRTTSGGRTRVVAHHVDAFDVDARNDGTLLVTLVTAKRDPSGRGWRRYANAITIHPKN